MTFNHIELPELQFELESETTDSGRVYSTPDGKKYPSITTVLSDYNKKAIYEWRQRVGNEEANRVSKAASGRGTRLHNAVEKLLLNEMTDMKRRAIMPDALPLYHQIEPILKEKVNNIYGIEQPLYSHKLKVAGRCDCIAEWEGVISIVDWKTAKKHKNKEDIANYFMQAAAYAEMFGEITGRDINQIVIALANDTPTPQIIIEEKTKYLSSLNNYLERYHSK
jgi:ATP-dependent exoDNAse (exonuclease V) beta subunit